MTGIFKLALNAILGNNLFISNQVRMVSTWFSLLLVFLMTILVIPWISLYISLEIPLVNIFLLICFIYWCYRHYFVSSLWWKSRYLHQPGKWVSVTFTEGIKNRCKHIVGLKCCLEWINKYVIQEKEIVTARHNEAVSFNFSLPYASSCRYPDYIPSESTAEDTFNRDSKVLQLLLVSWQEKWGTLCSLYTHWVLQGNFPEKKSVSSFFRAPNSSTAYVLVQHV